MLADDGYVGGPAAVERVLPLAEIQPPSGPLDRLSRRALESAAEPGLEPSAIWGHLYEFNTADPPDELASELGDLSAVGHFLGLKESESDLRSRLTATGWLVWPRSPESLAQASGDPSALTPKLYVSSSVDRIPECIAAVLEAHDGTFSFKIGPDLPNLLRSDRLVLHFETEERRSSVAEELALALRAVPAQGVPFTQPWDAGDGLISLGLDRPRDSALGRESWRGWVTRRLASALWAAMNDPRLEMSPVEYAQSKIWLDGVDPVTWGAWNASEPA